MARLLIIGRDGLFNAALAKVLRGAGHEVEATGTSAVDTWLVGGEPPDVLVVDAMQPHDDEGAYHEACEAEPQLAMLPRIVLGTTPARRAKVASFRVPWRTDAAAMFRELETTLVALTDV